MAPPIYFLPKKTRAEVCPDGRRLDAEVLRAYELDRQLGDVRDPRAELWLLDFTARGPGGHSGLMLCALPYEQPPPPRLGYEPSFQTWEQLAEDLWAGLDAEHPPTPADLRRRRPLLLGYVVELAGQKWSVPVIRAPDGSTSLPSNWRYNGDGQIEEAVCPEYRAIWEASEQTAQLWPELAGDSFDPDLQARLVADKLWIADRCLDALAVNYRIGRHEQNLLGLIRNDTWGAILGSTVDLMTVLAAMAEATAKKNDPDTRPESRAGSTDTAPGPPADSPTTALAAAS